MAAISDAMEADTIQDVPLSGIVGPGFLRNWAVTDLRDYYLIQQNKLERGWKNMGRVAAFVAGFALGALHTMNIVPVFVLALGIIVVPITLYGLMQTYVNQDHKNAAIALEDADFVAFARRNPDQLASAAAINAVYAQYLAKQLP